VDGPER
jgi:hypothetical protein